MKFDPIPLPLWLAETLRLREERDGPCEDSEICRRLQAAGGGELPALMVARAGQLAAGNGLQAAVLRWQRASRLVWLLLALLAVLGGSGMAFSALGDGSAAVNLPWALLCLLGLHLLTLAGWLLGLLLPASNLPSLARLWLDLGQRLHTSADWSPGPAWLLLLERAGLLRRTFGLYSHSLWLLTLGSALLMLIALLTTRHYQFVWQTTLLDAASLRTLVDALGWLPAQLGALHPDAGALVQSLDEAGRRQWALWLLACVLVYGLLPRLLLLLTCLPRALSAAQQARLLDSSLPGYARLRERLQPEQQRLGVVDADDQPQTAASSAPVSHTAGSGLWQLAIELDQHPLWPPVLPGVNDAGVLDDSASRRRLLLQFATQPPQRLLIACDPRRSPDRGTLALLGELARSAADTRIWLLPAPAGSALDAERLADWQAALAQAGLSYRLQLPAHWLLQGEEAMPS